MFSGGISQTKQHRVTHPCQVAVVSLLTRKQTINAHMALFLLLLIPEPTLYILALLTQFPWFPQLNYQPNNIDIGTKILYFQCIVTTDMFLFCKPIMFSGNCRICRDLAFGSVKTRFKAILKMLDFSAHIDFFMNLCPRRATKVRSL